MEAPGRLHHHRRHLKRPVGPPFRNLSPRSVLCPLNKINCYYNNNNNNKPLFSQFLSLSSLHANSPLHRFSVNSHSSFQDQNHGVSLPPLDWYGPGGSFGYRDGDRDVAVVVLGWLGAQEKHLRRYLDWYNSRGYRAEGFIVGVDEVLWRFDFARSVEERFEVFLEDLVQWVMQGKAIGIERSLVFHCFSNTGWLVYSTAMEKLQEKGDVYDRIKGCIVDSGGGELTNLKVWAAGFTTAMLKRQISPTYNSVDVKRIRRSKNGDVVYNIADQSCGDRIYETVFLATLEKFFFVLLNLPYPQRRLRRLESMLYNSLPPCPQLYLYSSADTGEAKNLSRVVPLIVVANGFDSLELKKQAAKDESSNPDDLEVGQRLDLADEQNLSTFFQEVDAIKSAMKEITDLLRDLNNLNEESKSTYSARALRGLRDRMDSNMFSILRKANTVKNLLEALDRSNLSNRGICNRYKEGTPIDRMRISVTNGLRVHLREMMKDFQSLRDKVVSDHREDMKRRYFNATGEEATEEVIDRVIMTGGRIELFGGKAEMMVGSRERHGAVMDIQRSLNKLHQVFLDMAVMVKAQGEKVEDIEENVARAGGYVSGGTNSLYYAVQARKNGKNRANNLFWAMILANLIVFLGVMVGESNQIKFESMNWV
ncbi:hypothetical protein MLD38_007769 [Melastoma candidum]|uniref:Uncharacterized protein n=1 Tax=Melastoma candidum TaxID=119954 RepID=A0ACB9RRC8_9MYRT|nr:hypothetical protein MLD38_007769 [Melastoma candidum]